MRRREGATLGQVLGTRVDEIEKLVKEHDVGFFILADEEPTINKRKFVEFCEELIKRDLGILWGINPFDQWGVELGKVLAEQLDRAIAGEDPGKRDPSTLRLVSRARKTQG